MSCSWTKCSKTCGGGITKYVGQCDLVMDS